MVTHRQSLVWKPRQLLTPIVKNKNLRPTSYRLSDVFGNASMTIYVISSLCYAFQKFGFGRRREEAAKNKPPRNMDKNIIQSYANGPFPISASFQIQIRQTNLSVTGSFPCQNVTQTILVVLQPEDRSPVFTADANSLSQNSVPQ